jgi:histidine ammonia-lyase
VSHLNKIVLSAEGMSLEDLAAVARKGAEVQLAEQTRQRILEADGSSSSG